MHLFENKRLEQMIHAPVKAEKNLSVVAVAKEYMTKVFFVQWKKKNISIVKKS